QLSVPNLDPKSRSHHTQTLTQPILASLLPAPVAVPQASLLTPTRLNRHNRLPRGGFLQTAVSDAPAGSPRLTRTLTVGRLPYSTKALGQLRVGRPQIPNHWWLSGGLLFWTTNSQFTQSPVLTNREPTSELSVTHSLCHAWAYRSKSGIVPLEVSV